MPVKVTRHYFELAQVSAPIRQLVKATPDETQDLAGAEDPGNQMDYSPVEGLLQVPHELLVPRILSHDLRSELVESRGEPSYGLFALCHPGHQCLRLCGLHRRMAPLLRWSPWCCCCCCCWPEPAVLGQWKSLQAALPFIMATLGMVLDLIKQV